MHKIANPSASPSPRVQQLLQALTLEEKLAQLQSIWLGQEEGGVVAPLQDDEAASDDFTSFAKDGLGQLTRVYGTKPVTPRIGLETALSYQRWLRDHTRVPIAALVHEECLTGLAAWTATTFPAPPAWGATFDPQLIEQMGAAIGDTMKQLGIHQGLAPVLDLMRDLRWGRIEEAVAEDPYLVGVIGSGYVRGLQSAGIIATLKHFAGYSASVGGRNHAPAQAGLRELQDEFFIPFEMALLDAGADSVMHSYDSIDGIPAAASQWLLTQVLRERWGFTGTVVADYFGIAFLHESQFVADSLGQAALQALSAGVDVELPAGKTFREPLLEVLAQNPPAVELVDRALTRVLIQKEGLGLLDIDAEISRLETLLQSVPETLDPPQHRALAAKIAEESVVLVANNGVLPLQPDRKIAVVGPNADRSPALYGCYSFVNHVLANNPGVPANLDSPTVLERLREEFSTVSYAQGCDVSGTSTAGFAQAVDLAKDSDVVIAVLGDQAGLFGRGTSGEGCDAVSLRLPGVQTELAQALIQTGKPVVLVMLTGRPYAIGQLVQDTAATVWTFFPGEEGAQAIAGVLSGRVNPSGHLPMGLPVTEGGQPFGLLHPPIDGNPGLTSVDATPKFGFGHGLSYTSFQLENPQVVPQAPTDGYIQASVTVRNTGIRAGAEVVQLYGRDLYASVSRPAHQFLGFAKVSLDPGESRRLTLRVPTTRLAYHNRDMVRVVEPGPIEVWFGASAESPLTDRQQVTLTGEVAAISSDSPRLTQVIG
jgi:beta-glucosidase